MPSRTRGTHPERTATPLPARVGDVDELVARADNLAAAWRPSAGAATTVGQERAILRLFGVHGLDRSGRPLAGEVVDRYVAPDPGRLGTGIALPFAMGLAEYDLAPQELALEVAAGAVDLGLEAELLAERDRRSIAEEGAGRLGRAAVERIDANRTARRELIALLGDTPEPWIGTTLDQPSIGGALDEAADAAGAGADLLRVDVPIGRELAARLAEAGVEVDGWHPGPAAGDEAGTALANAPTGSQRGIGALRRAIDESAAERRGYVRLATAAPALAAPEQAVVAAFERVDVVMADAMAEIVGGIDPDRALADHAFAHRLLARSGALLVVGAGPLAVARDLVAGVAADAATIGGRALALQLLGVQLARRGGLAPGRIVVGGLPDWVVEESQPVERAFAEIALRRAAMPHHPMAFVEPSLDDAGAAEWLAIVAAAMPTTGRVNVILRRPGPALARRVLASRAAADIGTAVGRAREPGALRGIAVEHARAVITAARSTLDRLSGDGWRAILGDPLSDATRLGADAVSERAETFDPLAGLTA